MSAVMQQLVCCDHLTRAIDDLLDQLDALLAELRAEMLLQQQKEKQDE